VTLGSVLLAGGSTLTVRVAEPDDERRLIRFYDQLTPDDQYRRFFNLAHPWTHLVHDWVRLEPDKGVRLLAELDGGEVVGDCGYFVLEEGGDAAELDITVTPRFRGWLGPYLLDNLVDVAASHGIESLRATVLRTNRPMLALLQARGEVTVGHDENTTVDLLISTRHGLPRWPAGDGPRVLVETAEPDWHAADSARSFGMQVVVCPGPSGGVECSELAGRPCPLARDADAIVFALSTADEDARAVLEAHPDLHPSTLLCVEARPEDVGEVAVHLPDAVLRLHADDPMAAAEVLTRLGFDPTLPHRDPGPPDGK